MSVPKFGIFVGKFNNVMYKIMNTLTFSRSGLVARFYAAVTMVSLVLSAFPAAFFVAEAATPLFSDSSITIDRTSSYDSGSIDITGYAHFVLGINFDAESLDPGDKFTFGWTDLDGEHVLDTVNGKNEGAAGDESKNTTYAFGPANGSSMSLFARVTSNSDSDTAVILTLSLTGEAAEQVVEEKVDICHWSEGDHSFSLLNVSVSSIGTAHGSAGGNDDDIIPILASHGGQNLDTLYDGMTGAEVLANDCVIAPVNPGPQAPLVCAYVGEVISYTDPAYRINNVEVSALRRGVAGIEAGVSANANFFGKESTYQEPDFFSLGMNGEVVYKFTDKVAYDQAGADIAIWETTGGPSGETNESVEVLVSQDGVTYESLGVIVGSAALDIAPAGLDFVQYVKVIDQGNSNDDGYDVDAITIIDDSCGDVPPPPQMCTLKLKSDTSNTVIEKLGANAVLTFVHNSWVQSLIDADWIWGDALVVNPLVDETQTFVNQFGWGLPSVTHATLTIAADNSFSADLNGSTAAEDLGQYNYTTLKTYDVTGLVQPGNNELAVAVKNFALQGSTPQSNPAGLYYELEITGEGEDCDVPYVPPVVDDQKPQVRIMYPEHGAVFFPGTIIATGTATDTDSGIVEVKYTITKIDAIGGTYVANVASGIASGTDAWEFPAFNLQPGFYRLKVQAFDAEGNWKYDYHDIQVIEEPRYENYCGDGEMNQEWEQCDGDDVAAGETCTAYCTLANQCSDLRLVKITLDPQAPASESFDGDIYLGSTGNVIPSSAWFNFDEVGDAPLNVTALGVDGLAVERTATALRLAVVGDNAKNHFDYAFGRIETLGIALGTLNRNTITGWALENSGDYKDVFMKDGDAALDFKFWLTTGNDAAAVEVLDGEPFDCIECDAEVEARVIIRDEDGAEIANGGLGNLKPQVILGDGTIVPFGEWFKLSEAPNPGDSAVWHDDADTVTNFPNPADLEGLFVSREGNGQVKVALYGYHNPGGDVHYESLRATIEFNDAKVASVAQIPGNFVLENHSETDQVQSNDNFDSFAVVGDNSAVDFDFWVDTKADGITITLDDDSVATCDEDTEPENPKTDPDTWFISGHKFEVGDDYYAPVLGWTIELRDGLGVFIATTTTDSNGQYSFEVEAGDYQVHEVMQADWVQDQVTYDGYPVDMDTNYDYCAVQVPDNESDYVCDFYNVYDPEDTVNPSTVTPPQTTRSSSGGSGTKIKRPTPQVLGESTTSFCPFIVDYMQIGWENDSWEVTKLQLFLNLFKGIFGGTDNPVTGTFDATTDANVKAFQEHFRSEILDPWYERGIVPHDRPTGFVYKTTRWKINDIVCPGWEAYPSFDGENLSSNVDITRN